MASRVREYLSLCRRLQMGPGAICELFEVDRITEWRWRQNGPPRAVWVALHLLLSNHRLERSLIRAREHVARTKVHSPEDRRGGLPAAVVRPRKRKGKAELRAEAERLITKE